MMNASWAFRERLGANLDDHVLLVVDTPLAGSLITLNIGWVVLMSVLYMGCLSWMIATYIYILVYSSFRMLLLDM